MTTSGPILRELVRSEFATTPNINITKQNFTALSSYNWTSSTKPTIFVPGSPPIWTPKPPGTQLNKDAGLVMIDQNAYRNPTYPLEPLFRSLFTMHPTFDTGSVDLVTDRNNLRKLLRFVTGESQKAFQIGVQRVGGTTMFTRMEKQSSEVLTGFSGFGFEFEKAYTTWPGGLEESSGHNRVVRYEVGGVRFVVRFELDAYAGEQRVEEVGGLGGEVCGSRGFDVVRRGRLVPQGEILEIKTRAPSRKIDMNDVLPQLWFSDTKLLVVAYHKGGRFDDVSIKKIDEEGGLEGWERANAEGLRKMVELVKVIMEEAGKVEGGCCMVCAEAGKLKIRGTAVKDFLPEDLKARLAIA